MRFKGKIELQKIKLFNFKDNYKEEYNKTKIKWAQQTQ